MFFFFAKTGTLVVMTLLGKQFGIFMQKKLEILVYQLFCYLRNFNQTWIFTFETLYPPWFKLPENFVIGGSEETFDLINLIDFGLSKKFIENNIHIK